jgi:Ca-activated chloride channel family protein
MRIIILLILFTLLNAGTFDFWNEKSAKNSYNAKKYHESSETLKGIDKNDIREYNLGNSLYKEGKYAQSREAYLKAKSVDRAMVFHNIGNSYFKENNMDEAIKAYEKAIAIRADKDTKFNLDLAKKIKQSSNKSKEEKKNKPKENPKQEPKNQNKEKQTKQDSSKNEAKQTKEMQQKEQSKKEMRHIMRKLEEKKMPTMMYPSQKSQRNNDDKNPW